MATHTWLPTVAESCIATSSPMNTLQPVQCAVGFLLFWLLLVSPASAAAEDRKLNLFVASGVTGGALTSAVLLLVSNATEACI